MEDELKPLHQHQSSDFTLWVGGAAFGALYALLCWGML